jgi:(p)ppGpp synthase/HD superfamily hydrolase
MNAIEYAIEFAGKKHSDVNQVRKWSGLPYITHPIAVSNILKAHVEWISSTELIAAILHDTVEDTNTTFDEIDALFGKEVRDLVWWLTDVAKPEDGNRATRMAINREHIRNAPESAQTIKAADCIHNLQNCVKLSGCFAFKYIPEKRATFEVLTKADPAIMKVFKEVLEQQEFELDAKAKYIAQKKAKNEIL